MADGETVIERVGEDDHAGPTEDEVERDQDTEPVHRLREGPPREQPSGGLRRRHHDGNEEREGEHRKEQFGEPTVGRDAGEERPDRHQTDRREDEHRRQRRGSRPDRQVVEEGERREGYRLNAQDEGEVRQRLPEKDRLARHRGDEEGIHRPVGRLDTERPMEPEEPREGEGHPEHARREDRRRDRRGIPREVKDDDREEGEDERGEERAPRAELDGEVLPRDAQRRGEQARGRQATRLR